MSTDTSLDYAPVGIVDNRDTLFTTLRNGDVAAVLTPIDTGLPTGGRWIIDAQSVPGLFSISYNPAVDTEARLVVANASLMPAAGQSLSVTAHYYDRYQIDSSGNPLPGRGIAETLVYTVEAGTTRDLAGFGSDLALGAGSHAANPALATLSDGGFVSVWQASGVDGGALWAQVRDAGGAARGAAFAVSPAADGAAEGEPAVAALAGGRFVVAYTTSVNGASRIAYQIVEANGSIGPQRLIDAAAGADTAMPDVAALGDGSFAIAWRADGQVHVRQVGADGSPLGAEQLYGALGSAYSPSIAATGAGYTVAWGEIGDGNVYAARAGGAATIVSGDGLAASITTAAPLPSVTALAGGGHVVAWDSYANSPLGFGVSDIFFQRYDAAGNPVGAMTQANVDSGGGRYGAEVSAMSNGGFMIAWQSQSGDFDGNGIFGRRFGADGNALDLQEFQINEVRQGDQSGAALTALANGGFASAWVDSDGGNVQVEARVLAGAAPVTVPAVTEPPASTVTTEPEVPAAPVVVAPAPVVTAPAPVVTAPAPVVTAPAPVVTAPAPVVTAPAPVVTTPKPAPSTASGGSTGSAGGVSAMVNGSDGANLLRAAAGSERIDGMGGVDTVSYGALRKNFSISIGSTGATTVVDKVGKGGNDTLVNVERIAFSDVSVGLDIQGNAGEAYRLYAAAFDRAPDKGGLGYWIKTLDSGKSLEDIAAGFIGSKEFADLYGSKPNDAQFVDLLYHNVLHREAEAAGRQFWIDSLAVHHAPREQILAAFSESAENQAQVIGAIQNGIEFIPFA
ncbi:DUF4214 domain-containing protein [Massilia niastensis]|uniref:DUF4214 domain-containing protein n=1 Tax=Massilia niastensis TaxID=544911 RepID=UPI000360FB75|nr:DUF4214 domain-containing protein [Massilia niastensis]